MRRAMLRTKVWDWGTHPLTAWALTQFPDDRQCHDRVTLAACLGAHLEDSTAINKAYLRVAEDLLASLEQGGHIHRDALGWCRRTNV